VNVQYKFQGAALTLVQNGILFLDPLDHEVKS